MDNDDAINTLKNQLTEEIKLSDLNKEYIVFLEKKIEKLEKINENYLNRIKILEEEINNIK